VADVQIVIRNKIELKKGRYFEELPAFFDPITSVKTNHNRRLFQIEKITKFVQRFGYEYNRFEI